MLVYLITNNINGKCYVGQTKRTIESRWLQHVRREGDCRAISSAIVKYGKENFTVSELARANRLNAAKPGAKDKLRAAALKFHSENPDSGRKHSEHLKKRYAEKPELLDLAAKLKGGKPFEVLSVSGQLVWRGINQAQCARDLGVSQPNICRCLKGRGKRLKGMIFKYVEGGAP